jgi:hypothetical protein
MENFNLKRFLVENKLTTNSKIIKENVEVDEVELGGVLFAVEDLDPLDDGVILSITKHLLMVLKLQFFQLLLLV